MTPWHILGAGALGQHFLEQWQLHWPNAQAQLLDRHSPRPKRIDRLLLCVKLPSLALALAEVQPLLHDNSLTLVVANGLGFEAALAELPGQQGLAITTAAAYLDSHGHHHSISAGQTRFGSLDAWPLALTASEHNHLLALGWQEVEDIRPHQWQKLAYNACINPLTVLFDCCNGDLLTPGPRRRALVRLADEIAAIGQQTGLSLAPDFVADVMALCQQTANNVSSSLQDFRRGKALELGYILPPWQARASQAGLKSPAVDALWQQLLSEVPSLAAVPRPQIRLD